MFILITVIIAEKNGEEQIWDRIKITDFYNLKNSL